MSLAALWILGVAGCAGASPSSATPESPSFSPEAASSAPSSDVASGKGTSTPTDDPGIPTECADPAATVCTPPGEFVDRLCDRPYPDVALALFTHGTPFTRAYLRGNLDELSLNEEVLVLRFRGPQKGGIIVGSNVGTYDLLRWDGSCSRGVEAEMVTKVRPPNPKVARLRWQRMGAHTQDSLVAASEAVKRARTKRGKECKGAMTGDVSSSCDKADDALTSAVVEYVRGGGKLPAPDDAP